MSFLELVTACENAELDDDIAAIAKQVDVVVEAAHGLLSLADPMEPASQSMEPASQSMFTDDDDDDTLIFADDDDDGALVCSQPAPAPAADDDVDDDDGALITSPLDPKNEDEDVVVGDEDGSLISSDDGALICSQPGPVLDESAPPSDQEDTFDETQQDYWVPPVGEYLLMDYHFERKHYVVRVLDRWPNSGEITVRFFTAWTKGDPLKTVFRECEGEEGTARLPARFIKKLLDPPQELRRSRFMLSQSDLEAYLEADAVESIP